MCEIQLVYGFGKDISKRNYKRFRNLLNCGSRYNNDAHGYLQLTNEAVYMDKARKLKQLFKRLGYQNETRFLLGHNRFATSNSKAFKDNHPFEIKNKYYWVHNGILWNSEYLQQKYNLPCESETDSEVIGHLIDYFVTKEGFTVQEAIEQTIQRLQGSYSVVFYDLQQRRIYYFKEPSTAFFFCMDANKMLFGTTIKDNLYQSNTFKGLNRNWEFELVPEPYAIYEFTYAGIKILSKVELENIEQETNRHKYRVKSKWEDTWENSIERWEGNDKEKEEMKGCEWCSVERKVLYWDNETNMYICEECIEEKEAEEMMNWDYDKKTYNPYTGKRYSPTQQKDRDKDTYREELSSYL